MKNYGFLLNSVFMWDFLLLCQVFQTECKDRWKGAVSRYHSSIKLSPILIECLSKLNLGLQVARANCRWIKIDVQNKKNQTEMLFLQVETKVQQWFWHLDSNAWVSGQTEAMRWKRCSADSTVLLRLLRRDRVCFRSSLDDLIESMMMN